MRHFIRDNRGLTLIELITAIAIGSIITLAATSILLLGLRIFRQSNDTVTRQNQIRIGMTVMEELAVQHPITGISDGKVMTTDGILLYQDGDKIRTGAGGQVMENVESFEAEWKDELLTLTVKLEDSDEEYTSVIRCPVTMPEGTQNALSEGDAVTAMSLDEPTTEELLAAAITNRDNSPNVRTFLNTLASQMGSTGRILNDGGEGEWYSQWYIGSYEDNPGWSEQTPWCACFVSWALEQCGGYLAGQIPRFANVDRFWVDFVTTDSWKTEGPEPGDIVFFDWIVDDEKNAQHTGVVLAVEDGWIHTIEGNSNGRVAVCRYAENDARIMGYGILNWT